MVETLCGVSIKGVATLVAACWAVTVTVAKAVLGCAAAGVASAMSSALLKGASKNRRWVEAISDPGRKWNQYY
jgi:hypothetical protein